MIKVKKLERVAYCQLGEGIWWESKNSYLWYVDIVSFALYRLNMNTSSLDAWYFDEEISWILPTNNKNKVLLGCASGVLLFNLATPEEKSWLINSFPNNKNYRLNDVGVDNLGRIWFGSMHKRDESLAVGQLVSFSVDNGLVVHDSGYKITNGPIISQDGKFLYHNDSAERNIYRYDLNLTAGTIANRIVFRHFKEEEGIPDGMCFDQKGNLLVAMWGSGMVQHIDIEGRTFNIYQLPVPNVTNVCFGGEKLDRLFVTTARIGLSEEDLQQYPDSGALFEITGLEFNGVLPNIQRVVE